MIPTIGVMIGAYIVFRAIDLILAKDRHVGASRIIVLIVGLLLILGTSLMTADLMMSGERTAADLELPRLR